MENNYFGEQERFRDGRSVAARNFVFNSVGGRSSIYRLRQVITYVIDKGIGNVQGTLRTWHHHNSAAEPWLQRQTGAEARFMKTRIGTLNRWANGRVSVLVLSQKRQKDCAHLPIRGLHISCAFFLALASYCPLGLKPLRLLTEMECLSTDPRRQIRLCRFSRVRSLEVLARSPEGVPDF